jgi:rare lipoprotein A
VNRWLAAAVLACACSCALAQEEAPVADSTAAVETAIAPAAAAAGGSESEGDSGTLSRLETGIASWYGNRFNGRKTASGERYDMHAFTAAHPRLPFGSWVRVRNLVNGRSVDVRINDRGPYIKRRIIDLSRAAAQALGLAGDGTRQVAIRVLTEAERLAN